MDYRFLSFEKAQYDIIPSYELAGKYDYSPAEWGRVLHNRQRHDHRHSRARKEKITDLAKALPSAK